MERERKPDINLSYKQAVGLFGMMNTMQAAPGKGAGAAAYHSIGRIWKTIGMQIGALELDEYGEPVAVEGWEAYPKAAAAGGE